jgi:hypothetical protein
MRSTVLEISFVQLPCRAAFFLRSGALVLCDSGRTALEEA